MREPAFWRVPGTLPRLLGPFGQIYAAATARRVARPGWTAPVPVLCCGSVTAGGAGKTPLALDLAARLRACGRRPAFLTRGHGGRRGALPVDLTRDSAADVGDEALLLAATAPTYVAADRAVAARAAAAAGADVLVMDDGLQNPTLAKTCSFLVIDGGTGFGNGRVIPAGPLREPVAAAAARCRAAVLVGDDHAAALAALPAGMPVLRARLLPAPAPRLRGARVVAFAGIGRPEKFRASLAEVGAEVVGWHAFADHHRFRPGELRALLRARDSLAAALVTTAKDVARLPPDFRREVTALEVSLAWEDPAVIQTILEEL